MKIACTFEPAIVPSWYQDLFGETVLAYFYCATKPKFVRLDKLSAPFADMVRRYYEVNKLEANFVGVPRKPARPGAPITYAQDPRKVAIMMSGGKDSVHLLLKLLEHHRKEDVFAVYVKNLNKSESYYETRAVKRICKHLGVDFKIVEPTNSVKLNRMNHNIALREELCTVLAVPYLLQRNVKHVYFGSFNSFVKIDPIMYCSSKECLEFINKWTEQFGCAFEFHNHVHFTAGSHIAIFEEMVSRYPDVMQMTSSCYTQLNFREHRFELFKKKLPDVPIYQGCGSCVKCLRINSAILLFDQKAKNAPESQRRYLFDHLNKFWQERYANDSSLTEHMRLLKLVYA